MVRHGPFSINWSLFAFFLTDNDGHSADRNILRPVFHHGYNDILCERVLASTSHEDAPSVIPDACGGHYGTSTLTRPTHSSKQ
jgi:hypothetical protein